MEQIKIPDGYQSSLNLHDTQIAIKTVKDFFQQTLAQKLNLLRVSAPVFVNPSSLSPNGRDMHYRNMALLMVKDFTQT